LIYLISSELIDWGILCFIKVKEEEGGGGGEGEGEEKDDSTKD